MSDWRQTRKTHDFKNNNIKTMSKNQMSSRRRNATSSSSSVTNWRDRARTTSEEEPKKIWLPAPPVKKNVWGSTQIAKSTKMSTKPVKSPWGTTTTTTSKNTTSENVPKKTEVKTVWGRPVNAAKVNTNTTTLILEENPLDKKKNLTKRQRRQKVKSKTLKKSVNVLFNQAKRLRNGKELTDQRLPAAIKVTKTFEDDPKAFDRAIEELKRYRNHVLGPKTEKKTKSTKKTRKKLSTLKKRVLDERLRLWKEHTGKDYNPDGDDEHDDDDDDKNLTTKMDESEKKNEEEEERRVDPTDGNAYTKDEFVQAYGGLKEWEDAAGNSTTQEEVERRIDSSDGNLYTKEEFIQAYGGLKEWDAATSDEKNTNEVEEEEEEELRIDPNDGKAYNKAEFLFEYNGLTEWNNAKIAKVVKSSSDPFGMSKENGRYVKPILCKDNATRYVVYVVFVVRVWYSFIHSYYHRYWNGVSFKSEDRTRNRRFETKEDAEAFFNAFASKMKSKIERRIDTSDNLAYTLSDFLAAYGEEQGTSKWNESKVYVDPEHEKLFTLVKQKRKRPMKVPRLVRLCIVTQFKEENSPHSPPNHTGTRYAKR